jgi:hypothetical protein
VYFSDFKFNLCKSTIYTGMAVAKEICDRPVCVTVEQTKCFCGIRVRSSSACKLYYTNVAEQTILSTQININNSSF